MLNLREVAAIVAVAISVGALLAACRRAVVRWIARKADAKRVAPRREWR